MASEITFGYKSGETLTYGAYQPDGTVRTAAATSLPEIAGTGYYVADDADIVAEDFVIVKLGTVIVGQGQYKPEVSASDINTDVTAILEDTSTTIPATLQTIIDTNQTVTNVYDETTPPPIVAINV